MEPRLAGRDHDIDLTELPRAGYRKEVRGSSPDFQAQRSMKFHACRFGGLSFP